MEIFELGWFSLFHWLHSALTLNSSLSELANFRIKMKTDAVADDNTPFQAKLQSKEGNKKLVLYPHGGPHSNSFRFFSKLRLDFKNFHRIQA